MKATASNSPKATKAAKGVAKVPSTPTKNKYMSISYQTPTKEGLIVDMLIAAPYSTPIDWSRTNGANAYASPLPHAPFAPPNAPKKK